jgi:hypothetical protein
MPLWTEELISVMKSIYWSKRSLPSWVFSQGKTETLQFDSHIGRLFELLHKRMKYDLSIREIERAGWRRTAQ